MPIDVEETDRDRVFGMIRAYLRGKVSIRQAVAAVNTSSFRDQELRTILHEAEQVALTIDVKTREILMATLRETLQKEGFLD